MSLGSVDISFREPVGNSVEVRSEALLCPGYPCHLLFSEMGKTFEEKDENKGKKKKCSLDTVKLPKPEGRSALISELR